MDKFDLSKYDVFFVDMDGVIVKSNQPIEGSPESLQELTCLGDVYVLSNNSTRSRKEFADNMQKMGMDIPPESVINSAYIISEYLVETMGSAAVYPVGEEGLTEELEIEGNRIVPSKEADAVVAGLDRTITYDKLAGALEALLRGAKFYAANTDKTFPTPQGERPGAGATVGAITGMGFPPDLVTGKPSEIAAEIAMETAGISYPEKCLVIGDRAETDIQMANKAGMDSVLTLSGVKNPAGQTGDLKPTLSVNSLSELVLG